MKLPPAKNFEASCKSVITIDGPVASGKTSVSRDLAKALGWNWVSTGAFYRGLSYVANQEQMDLSDHLALAKLATSTIWSVQMEIEDTKVIYRNEDVSLDIKKERVGATASQISVYPEVRSALLKAQRDCALASVVANGLVAEGRDCGSVVFPDASAKFYLTARSESRAERRALERNESVQKVEAQQATRDANDQQRAVAPLQVPDGAIIVDTSEISLAEVVATILRHLKR